jgi:hypothetical protein
MPGGAGPRGERLIAVALLLVILSAGVGIGIAVDRLWLGARVRARTEGERTERLVQRFRSRLELDDAQTATVREALGRSRRQVREIRDRVEPEVKQVRSRARDEITRALTPAQRERFKKMVERYEARRAARRQP